MRRRVADPRAPIEGNSNPLDGVGYHTYRESWVKDLDDLEAKQGYAEALGIDALMLGAMNEWAGHDRWYSVTDYDTIHSALGDEETMARVAESYAASGIGLVIDLVANHTSDQHRWFSDPTRRAWYHRLGEEDLAKFDKIKPMFPTTEGIPGTSERPYTWREAEGCYTLHTFFNDTVDLDNNNPEVQREFGRIVRRWIEKWKVTGIRADACVHWDPAPGTNGYSQPGAFVFMEFLRKLFDQHYPGRFWIAEANDELHVVGKWLDEGRAHTAYHFLMGRAIDLAHHHQDWAPVLEVHSQTPDIHPKARWSYFLRNHDDATVSAGDEGFQKEYFSAFSGLGDRNRLWYGTNQRTAELLRFSRRAILGAHGFIFALRGKPWIYAGDEYGDPGGEGVGRQRVRTFSWEEARRQLARPKSLLNGIRELIDLRNREPAMKWGDPEEMLPRGNPAVLPLIRTLSEETCEHHKLSGEDAAPLLWAFSAAETDSKNLRGPRPEANLPQYRGRRVVELLTGEESWIDWDPFPLHLPSKGMKIYKILPKGH